MEYMNCEQYVLAQLEDAQRENKVLQDKVQKLSDKLAKATKEPSRIKKRVADEGRKLVFEKWFYYSYYFDSNNSGDFEKYCINATSDFYRPDDISRVDAICEFEPELRHMWEKMLAEYESEKEDAEWEDAE